MQQNVSSDDFPGRNEPLVFVTRCVQLTKNSEQKFVLCLNLIGLEMVATFGPVSQGSGEQ